jgi:hypothetical protein
MANQPPHLCFIEERRALWSVYSVFSGNAVKIFKRFLLLFGWPDAFPHG